MVNFLEKFLYLIGHSYRPLARLVSYYLSREGHSWHRHSVYLRHSLFLVSDIDLTYLGNDTLNVMRKYKKVKKILPMIGEINCYKLEHLKYIETCHNQLELERDPIIFKKIKSKNANHPRVTAIVYLLRNAYSDKDNLKKHPGLRVRKWRYHLSKAAEFCQLDAFLTIEDAINKLSGGGLIYNSGLFEEKVLFPHLWFQKNYQDEDFKALVKEAISSSEFTQHIFISQLAWEFCGVISQIATIDNANNVKTHFLHILNMVSFFDTEDARDLCQAITSFCSEEFGHC